jgi:hypothetical protein
MQKLNYYIEKFYTCLKVTFQKKQGETINHFNPLTPTEDAEDCEIYIESIEWALRNKKTIRNIAISGTYGSGKSSIIKTFIKRIRKSENFFKRIFKPTYRFLNISLATFKDTGIQQPQPDRNNGATDKELLRLIELSILQQLFFHEKNHKTPDSRFKKIKKESSWKLVLYTCLTLLSLLSILYLFFPKIFHTISIISSIKVDSIVVSYIASSIIIISVFLLILKSSRGLLSASIKKLNINNAEIEIDKGISKSVLNNHLDEIIYFFEATKYNVVIIEDLDRFEQTEVFTKLREINLLINNSNKIKRDVVFIYAIKDDMFVDKDRAKFFDFMIPIIPVIDYSNSGNKLLKIIQQNNYNISHDLIDDLSMFIDDMRLLYNIMNEFYIYSNKLGQRFQNQLLAMIVYKNIFPNDFTKLSQNEGDLYKTINKKRNFIKDSIAVIDKEIEKIKEKIEIKNQQKLRNKKELRALYVLALIDNLKSTGFMGFNIDGSLLDNSTLCEDANFELIIKGSIIYSHKDYYNSIKQSTHNFKFKDIELKVDKNYSYKQREELLDKNGTIELKNDIKQLTEKKNEIQKFKVKDLLSNKQIVVEIESDKSNSENKKKNDLINILLRNGYIDENYTDYISIFHEGALTKSDYQLLINVKKEETTEYSYNIIKKEEFLKKVDDFAFEKPYIFNHGLIDFLLKTKTNEKKKEFLLKQLSNETTESISFINEYLDNSIVVEVFIKNLCHYWTNIWNYIRYKSQYTDERIDKYFRLIIQYADVDDIEKIFEKEYDYLTNYSDFLNIITTKRGKLEQIIERLNLKFVSIEIDSPKPLLEYIFKNSYYDINIEMLRTLISFNSEFDTVEFETANYGYILSKRFDYQIEYIHSEIDEYVQSVYLQLENNKKEKLEHYIQLINYPNLDFNLKEEIIEQVDTYIEDVSEINDNSVVDLLFKYSKVKASWDNVVHSFEGEENKFSTGLIEYLNTLSNAELLSKERMTTVKIGEKSKYSVLCRAIIYEQKIQSTSYKLLLKSIPWWYEEFDSEKLSKDRIAILIEAGKVNPTISSYQFLKDNFEGTNILLLEKYIENFEGKIDEITIDSSDLNLVLKSTKLTTKYKFYVLDNCDEDIITEKTENLGLIAQLVVGNESYSISDTLKLSIITEKSILQKNKLILFNRNINLIKKSMLDVFLISMGGDYAEIPNTSKKAILEDNVLNRELLDNLIKLDYISSYSEKEKGLRVNHKRKE